MKTHTVMVIRTDSFTVHGGLSADKAVDIFDMATIHGRKETVAVYWYDETGTLIKRSELMS